MIIRQFIRSIHTNTSLYQAINKSLLAKLRKKTGYTFVNCKKALEANNNDIEKAEEWLKAQAQQHGWGQAQKLQNRVTTQGVIAMIASQNHGALVEINCETDFVARNDKFRDLAETVATVVLNHGKTLVNNVLTNKVLLHSDTIKALPATDGKTLGDISALTIGTVGENINIKRAICLNTHSDIKVFGCTHPTPVNPSPISFGKYGALIALKCDKDHEALGTQLCQHIIGLNPTKVGDVKVDEPLEDTDSETILLYQEFLLDPELSVQQLLENNNVEIVDFARFEVGQVLEDDPIIDTVETCG